MERSELEEDQIINIPAEIMREAKARVEENSKTAFNKFLQHLERPLLHPVLASLPSITGLPRSVYLCRLNSIGEFIPGQRKVSTVSVIEENLNVITEFIDEGQIDNASRHSGMVKRIEALRQLCELANSIPQVKDFEEWARRHSTQLHNAFIYCLNIENPLVIEETAVTISFLARKLHFALLKSAETLITAMVAVLAIAMTPTETHVEALRRALDFHQEMEITKARSLAFHFPRQNYEFSEPKFRIIGYIYYALADFLYNVPYPFLIHYFQCRILRRKEMTRRYLFRILYAIIENLSDLEDFAMKHCPKVEKPKVPIEEERAPPTKPIFNPLVNTATQQKPVEKKNEAKSDSLMYKPDIYRKEQWENLPAKLYIEMFRAFKDRNPDNQNIIANILTELKSISHVKLPTIDLSTANKLEQLKPDIMERVSRRIRIAIPKMTEGGSNAENEVRDDVKKEEGLGNAQEGDNEDVVGKDRGGGTALAKELSTETKPTQENPELEEGMSEEESLADSSSYRSDPAVMRALNRPTILLEKPPDLSILKHAKTTNR
ncbi:hypothetical protein Aperf_G00000054811 [Anoplocephala perfoliata]